MTQAKDGFPQLLAHAIDPFAVNTSPHIVHPTVLYCYTVYPSKAYGDVERMNLDYVQRLNNSGFRVVPFCLTPTPPREALPFVELDYRWKTREMALMTLYEKLAAALEGCDVLLNASGANLHPEFVIGLRKLTVFQCFDDPENSHNLSLPAASAYDLALVGNAAEVAQYKARGLSNSFFIPLGLRPGIYKDTVSEEDVIRSQETRDINLFMMIDRFSFTRARCKRLNEFAKSFPDGHFYGRGWTRGYLPAHLELPYLWRAKIGPNFHNSTGPVNSRTYYIPANGAMLITDNLAHLSEVYSPGVEACGFSDTKEGIEMCRYYSARPHERIPIALAGWRRAVADYNEQAVFSRTLSHIRDALNPRPVEDRIRTNVLPARQTAGRGLATLKWKAFCVARTIARALRVLHGLLTQYSGSVLIRTEREAHRLRDAQTHRE